MCTGVWSLRTWLHDGVVASQVQQPLKDKLAGDSDVVLTA
jgi:hypothetical protein